MGTIIVSVIIFGAFALAGYNAYKRYKNKGSCSCCSGCPSENKCNK